jgi:hypothetical protein
VVYVSDRLWFMRDRVRPIRGLWRLLDVMVESGLISDSELRGGSPHPCRLRTDRLTPVDKFEMCTDTCEILCGPVNLVASVTAWSNRNRYSMVVVGGRMRLYGGRWRENEVAQDDSARRSITVEPRLHPECRGVILTSDELSER